VTTTEASTLEQGTTITALPPKAAQKSSDTAVSTIKLTDSPSIHYSSSYEVNSKKSHQKSTQPPTPAASGAGGLRLGGDLQLGGGLSLGAGLGSGSAMPVIATPEVAPTVTVPATPAPVSNMGDAATTLVTVKHRIFTINLIAT
jgi:hypothetical protein